MKTSTPDALILRNYECEVSQEVANWIAERLAERRYGGLYVEPNYDFFDPKQWYKQFNELVSIGIPMVALLSPALTRPADADASREFPGIALMSELLYFWHNHHNEPGFDTRQLIPVLVNCSPDDLCRPSGEYEQLQDIVVPFVSQLEPL